MKEKKKPSKTLPRSGAKPKAPPARKRRASEGLHETETLYRALAEAALDMIFIIGRDERVEYVNRVAAESLGRKPEDMIGRPRAQFFPSGPSDRQGQWLSKVFKSGKPLFSENYTPFQGRDLWLHTWLVPLQNEAGETTSVLGISRDITERKKMELSLRESEERYRTLLEISPDAIVLVDPEAKVLYCNQKAADFFFKGKRPDEVVGRDSFSFLSLQDRTHSRGIADRALSTGNLRDIEFCLSRKDGSPFYIEVSVSVIPDAQGQPKAYLGVARDITSRKKAEETLKESEQRLRDAQALGRMGSWEFHIESNVLSWSDQTFVLYERDRTLGAPTPEEEAGYYTPEQSRTLLEYASKAIETGQTFHYDLQTRLPSGRTAQFAATMRPIKDATGRVVKLFGTVQDITARKQMEESLRESEEKYRTLVERAADGILIIQDGVIQYTNPRLGVSSGYEAEEIQGKRFTQFVHPTEVPNVVDRYRRRLAGEDVPAIYDLTLLRKDGSKLPAEINAGVISYQGRPADLVIVRDLSERKRSEEALQAQERFLDSIYSSIQDGISVLDRELRILSVNPTMEQWYAHAMPLVGKKCYQAYHGLTVPCDVCPTRRTLEAGRAAYEVVPRRGKDGEVVGWLDLFSFPQVNPETKEIEGVIEYVRDITERKWAEEKIQESELQHRTTLDFMGDAIHVVDRNLRLVLLNDRFKQWCRDLGLETEIIGRTIFEAFPFLPQTVREEYDQVFQTGETLITEETSLVGGREIITETRKIPIHQTGKVAQVVTVVHDITKRKKAEEALRKNYEHQGLILNTLPVVFYTAAPTSDLPTTWISDQIQAITGFSPRKFTEEPWFWTSRIHPEDHERVLLEYQAVLTQGSVNVEYRWQAADGAYRWFLDTAVLARDPRGQLLEVNGIWVDITERKRAEEDLQAGVDRLRQALWETIEAMAVIVETRDPYTAGHQRRVTLLAQTIAREMALSEEQIQEIRMSGLIHDIGKISVPAEILSKPTPLSEIEFSIIKSHVQVGFDILKTIEFPWPVASIVAQHHERMDGSGYPNGLPGEEIFIEARIIAVADVIEAMSSYRPYRPAPGLDKALDEISRNRGLLYDPQVVDACLKLFNEKGFSFDDGERSG